MRANCGFDLWWEYASLKKIMMDFKWIVDLNHKKNMRAWRKKMGSDWIMDLTCNDNMTAKKNDGFWPNCGFDFFKSYMSMRSNKKKNKKQKKTKQNKTNIFGPLVNR